MSKTNHGTVEVTIGDDIHTLKPTLKAVKAIEARFGGILPALTALGSGNLTATAFVVGVGTGLDLSKKKALEPLEEAVFEAGLNDVGSQVIPYLSALLNPGAQTPEELEKAAESGNE